MCKNKKLLNYANELKNLDKNINTYINTLILLQEESAYARAKLTYAFEKKLHILDKLSSF